MDWHAVILQIFLDRFEYDHDASQGEFSEASHDDIEMRVLDLQENQKLTPFSPNENKR